MTKYQSQLWCNKVISPLFPTQSYSQGGIEFAPEYWTGKDNLRLGLPWLTPGAILFLDNYLKPDSSVLELGSGGSTLFFSRRYRQVVSVESNAGWTEIVAGKLEEEELTNVELKSICTEAEQLDYLDLLQSRGSSFRCILVDSEGKFNRRRLAENSLSLLEPGGILVIDNYAGHDRGLHFWFSENRWESFYFNDPHWWGMGTSIHIKPFQS